MPSDWYKSAFGDLYPIIYAHRDDEAAAAEVAALIQWFDLEGSAALTLDLCCGDGRHGTQLSELGLSLIGIDLSPQLLERATMRPALRSRLVRGDMRQLPFGAAFDLVLNLFTSFGYFIDESENRQALFEMGRVLAPGGRLVIDHINRDWVEKTFVAEDQRREQDYVIRQRRTIEGDRVRKAITVTWQGGREIRMNEDVRMYRPEEIQGLLTASGLTQIQIAGDYHGAPLGEQSKRLIVTAVKPG
jgi:SAM-dependent methyltransferase